MLRPQTYTIATAKQSCLCTEIYSYENAQKLLPPELLLLAHISPNRLSAGASPQTPLGELNSPDSLAGIGGGPPGEREGGRGGGKEVWEGM